MLNCINDSFRLRTADAMKSGVCTMFVSNGHLLRQVLEAGRTTRERRLDAGLAGVT